MSPTRRSILKKASSSLGIVALAGCMGDGGDGGDGNTPTPSNGNQSDGNDTDGNQSDGSADVELRDPAFTNQVWTKPDEGGFNSYNPTAYTEDLSEYLFDPLTQYNPQTGEYLPHAATDWTIDGKTVELSLLDGHKWHDGTAVTARDLVTKLRIDKHIGTGFWEYASSVAVADEKTVQLTLAETLDPAIVKSDLLNLALDVKHEKFKQYLEGFQDASTESETEKAKKDLIEAVMPEPFGNSVFQLEDRTSREATYTRFEEHPYADRLNYDEFSQPLTGSNQKAWSGFSTGKIDGMESFTPPNVYEEFPEWSKQSTPPEFFGMGVLFNHDAKHASDRRVRRAVAHLVNRTDVARSSGGPLKVPVKYATGLFNRGERGLFPAQVKEYFGDDIEKLYPYEPSEEKATELLRSAGYTKDGGTWVDSEGSALRMNLHAPSGWSDWISGAQSVVGQLQQAGIKSSLQTTESSSFFSSVIGQSDFRMATYYWPNFEPLPYVNLKHMLTSTAVAESANYDASALEVPPLSDPSGSPEPVGVQEHLTTMRKGQQGEKEATRRLAWAVNYDLPMLPLQQKLGQLFLATNDWEVAEGSEVMETGNVAWGVVAGQFRGKPKN